MQLNNKKKTIGMNKPPGYVHCLSVSVFIQTFLSHENNY